jgi:hypothetical protein
VNLPSANPRYDPSQENEMRRIVERAINDLTTQVVKTPAIGWGIPTGTASTATFDTATVTLPQLAGRVFALIELMRKLGYLST